MFYLSLSVSKKLIKKSVKINDIIFDITGNQFKVLGIDDHNCVFGRLLEYHEKITRTNELKCDIGYK